MTLYSCSYLVVFKQFGILKIQKGKTALVMPEHISEDLDLVVLFKKKQNSQTWSEREGNFLLMFQNIFRMQDTGMEVLILYLGRILKEHLTDCMLEKNPKIQKHRRF